MLSSPFQQPSSRQNALALQIQVARTSGDEALLAGLISQWVHRYGFDGAAELDLSLPEPVALNREFSPTPLPVVQEELAAEETLLQRSFPSAPVPAPPISTPRSLRRWLPRREDDAFPKAS